MTLRFVKIGAIATVGFCLVGGFVFGTDLVSYVRTSASSVRSAVRDAVPIEFELQRANNMLAGIIPEMHANIRLIAQEEVEVAALKGDIERSENALADRRNQICKLRQCLTVRQASYTLGGFQYAREQLTEELARRFDQFKEAEIVLAGKQQLLSTREKSLRSAMDMLQRMRWQKARLEDQINALEGQYRVIQAASVDSPLRFDNSKLAKTKKLIGQIKRRLDIAERILAHEARFVQPVSVERIGEKDLLEQVDEYFAPTSQDDPGVRDEIADAGPARKDH